MTESIGELSVVGILALLLYWIVRDILKARKNGGMGPGCIGMGRLEHSIAKLETQTNDLHQWHKPNPDGEQVWKNATLVECIKEMRGMMEKQTILMARLVPVIERLEQKV